MLSATERKILIEIDIKKFISAQSLSRQLLVSEKTVYRRIKSINQKFEQAYNCKIIKTEKGKGFTVEANFSKLELSKIINIDSEEFTISEQVTIKLIECAPNPITINKLFSNYYLSESSVNRIIKKLELNLKSNNLQLIRFVNELQVIGFEQDLRECLSQLYTTLLNKNSFLTVENHELGLNQYSSIIEETISNIEKQTNAQVIEPYYTNMYVYIHILLRRYECGEVEFEENYSKRSALLLNEEINIGLLAQTTIDLLRHKMSVKLKAEEVDNIYKLILSSRMTTVKLCMSKDLILMITNDYLSMFFEDINGLNLNKLQTNLMSHIGPMLFRNENGVEFKNYLTTEIKSTYMDSFSKLLKISNEIKKKYKLNNISEDEIAYITLYFEEYLLSAKQRLQVYIMCVSGVGTSNLLRVKLAKLSNDIEIIGILNYEHLLNLKVNNVNVDLIISTVNIENSQVPIPIVYVNPLLSEDDANNILSVIKEVKDGRKHQFTGDN